MKNIKKSLLVAVAALAMGSMTGCDFLDKLKGNQPQEQQQEEEQKQEEQKVIVESLTLDTSALDLVVGQKHSLVATVLPENATDKSVVFKSSKADVASVSLEGEVTAVGKGTAVITAQSASNPGKFAQCVVTVEEAIVHVTSVEIGANVITITADSAPVQLQATVLPDNATDKSLTWESTNPAAATVSATGLVTPVAIGVTTIIVTSNDNPAAKNYFTVNVEATVIPVASVDITQTGVILEENDEPVQLTANVLAADPALTPSNTAVSWSSSDPGVASVSSTGLVTPHLKGNATITVTTSDGGFTDTCDIQVTRTDVDTFSLDITKIAFSKDATGSAAEKQLTAIIDPVNATYQEVVWSSNDETVATVSDSGLVHIQGKVGTALITALHVNSRKTATCAVTVVDASDLEVDFPVSENKSYTSYIANKAANPSNPDAEFVNRTETYEVGDDNAFSFKPEFTVTDSQDITYDSNAWPFPFIVTVEKKDGSSYTAAQASEFTVTDDMKCEVDFADSAVGNTYRVSARVGGYDSVVDGTPLTAVYEVKVVDGYNVTNELEINYLDSRTTATTEWLGNKNYTLNYPQWKQDHGLTRGYTPTTLVLHKDMNLGAEHFPEVFFYDSAEANEDNWSAEEKLKSIGSLKDWSYMMQQHADKEVTLSGNYFSLDFSRVPLVKRTKGEATADLKKTESHSKLFMGCNGDFHMKNLNMIGNAGVASGESETYLAGGLIAFDLREAMETLTADNVLAHNCYITFMNDGNWPAPGLEYNVLTINDSKLSDNYNCFMYNYGGKVIANRSKFEGCGGPVVIQDHIIEEEYPEDGQYHNGYYDTIDTTNGQFILHGHHPWTEFNDCDIRNYVIGTEAWFISFGATALVGGIKDLSDAVWNSNQANGLSYLFDENHAACVGAMQAAQAKDSMMNLIVINKSNKAENVTAYPVDGTVIFKTNDNPVDTFNYMNPVGMTAATAEEQSRFTAEVTTYQIFRGVNNNGAPVFETAGGHATFGGTKVCSMENLAVNGNENVDAPAGFYNDNGHLALYYTGMMLVLGAGHVGA